MERRPQHRLPGRHVRVAPALDRAATVWLSPTTSIVDGLRSLPLILLLHGKGGTEESLLWLTPHLPQQAVIASLRAPYRVGTGWGWFPPSEVSSWQRPTEQFREGCQAIVDWLDDVAPQSSVIPVGFSQGGAMAAQLVRAIPRRILGAAVLSGFVHHDTESDDKAARRVPVYVEHGTADTVTPISAAEATATLFDTPLHALDGVGHTITRDAVEGLAIATHQLCLRQ